ncbi:MAG: PD40 domain-containing protein [Anaerolineales bacterium]|nr:PD40 domain-containing protein [Anaerolineales bacterium]
MMPTRDAFARAAATTILFLLIAGCGTPVYMEKSPVVPTGTASRTPTCQQILCTPDGGETPAVEPSAESRTPSPTLSTPSLTPTFRPGLEFTPPSLLAQQGMLALTLRRNDHAHIWLWPLGLSNPFPVTDTEAAYDDRDPAFSPDGSALAFASQRNGGWDLYIKDLATGDIRRLTDTKEYEAHPSWSPDSRQLVYERYVNGRLRISIRRVEDQALMWPGPDGMDSFEPSWSSLARAISFTGRIGRQTDIFVLNLDSQQIINLTNTPDMDERGSAFSPDGTSIAYSLEKDGFSWIYRIASAGNAQPVLVGQGDKPEWSPDSKWLAGVFHPDLLQSYLLFSPSDQQVLSPSAFWLPGRIENLAWTSSVLPDPLPGWLSGFVESGIAPTSTKPLAGTPLTAQLVDLDVNAPDPRLSSTVVQRFQALRTAVRKQSGWDFLGTLDNAVIDIDTPMPPRETESWLRTGRAFAISRAAITKGWLVVLPDPTGVSDFWRLFIRTAVQDGSLGEPLREFPWDFDARTSGTPSAFDSGGQLFGQIPTGYFMDFSQLAAEYGFQRLPSDSDWRTYYFGIHYWEFVCADGLDWITAMGELYSPYLFLTPTPRDTPITR